MTVAAIAPTVTYLENGSTVAFAVPFQFIGAGDIAVTRVAPDGTRALAVRGVDFNVAGGAGLTGTVTMSVAKPSGWSLRIERRTAQTQPTDYTPGDRFPAESHERALDRVTMIAQEVAADTADITARSVRVPAGESLLELPPAASRVSKFLGFIAAGAASLFSASQLALALAPALLQLLPATFKGDPGGPFMAVGSFTALPGLSIPVGTDIIQTSEHRAGSQRGRGAYRALPQGSLAADQAFAAAHPGWSALTANSRLFVLDEEQDVNFEQFAAYGDYGVYAAIPTGTDDYPQWLWAKDFLDYHIETHNNAYYKSVPRFRFGRHKYRFSQPINLDQGVYDIRGTGPHAVDRGGNTEIYVESGKCAFIFQSWDTAGVSGTTANTPKGSAYSYIADIAVYASGGTLGAEEHGYLIKAPVILERCFAYNFGGCGFRIIADVGTGGNANCGKLVNCGALNNGRSGLKITGGDSNAWEIYGFNGTGNLAYAIHDEPFLCTHYFGGHTAGNGARQGPFWATNKPYAGCSSSGYRYVVIPGQETWASTHAPSGAATSNQGWLYVGAGGVDATFHPAWVSGLNLLAGGAVLINGDNSKTFEACVYMEGDQFQGVCYANRALILGGGLSGWTGGAQLNAHDGRLWTPRIATSQFSQTGVELAGQTIYFCNGGNVVFSLSLNNGRPHIGGLASYASNAAAVTAGLAQNDMYLRTDGTMAAVL